MTRGPMSGAGGRGERTSQTRVLDRLRIAARKGDHTALALALDEMRTLAYTPRYWMKYLALLRHPLARLVDLLVIKQGDKIARQKGWTGPARRRSPRKPKPAKAAPPAGPRARVRRRAPAEQASLFPEI